MYVWHIPISFGYFRLSSTLFHRFAVSFFRLSSTDFYPEISFTDNRTRNRHRYSSSVLVLEVKSGVTGGELIIYSDDRYLIELSTQVCNLISFVCSKSNYTKLPFSFCRALCLLVYQISFVHSTPIT